MAKSPDDFNATDVTEKHLEELDFEIARIKSKLEQPGLLSPEKIADAEEALQMAMALRLSITGVAERFVATLTPVFPVIDLTTESKVKADTNGNGLGLLPSNQNKTDNPHKEKESSPIPAIVLEDQQKIKNNVKTIMSHRYYEPGLTFPVIKKTFNEKMDFIKRQYQGPYFNCKPDKIIQKTWEHSPCLMITLEKDLLKQSEFPFSLTDCFLLLFPYYLCESVDTSEDGVFIPVKDREIKFQVSMVLVKAVAAGFRSYRNSKNKWLVTASNFYPDFDNLLSEENTDLYSTLFDFNVHSSTHHAVSIDEILESKKSLIEVMEVEDRANLSIDDDESLEDFFKKSWGKRERKDKKQSEEQKLNKDSKLHSEDEQEKTSLSSNSLGIPQEAYHFRQQKIIEAILMDDTEVLYELVFKPTSFDDLNFVCDFNGTKAFPAMKNVNPLKLAVEGKKLLMINSLLELGASIISPLFLDLKRSREFYDSRNKTIIDLIKNQSGRDLQSCIISAILNEYKTLYGITLIRKDECYFFAAIGDMEWLQNFINSRIDNGTFDPKNQIMSGPQGYSAAMLAAFAGFYDTYMYLMGAYCQQLNTSSAYNEMTSVLAKAGHIHLFERCYENLKNLFTSPAGLVDFETIKTNAFFMAIDYGRFAIIEFLLLSDIKLLSKKRFNGDDPWMAADNAKIDMHHKKCIVTLLTSRKPKVTSLTLVIKEDEPNKLWVTFQNEQYQLMKEIHEQNPKLMYELNQGKTLLHVAAYTENVRIIRFLLENDKKIGLDRLLYQKDDKGRTALFIAANEGLVDVFKTILEADINFLTLQDQEKKTFIDYFIQVFYQDNNRKAVYVFCFENLLNLIKKGLRNEMNPEIELYRKNDESIDLIYQRSLKQIENLDQDLVKLDTRIKFLEEQYKNLTKEIEIWKDFCSKEAKGKVEDILAAPLTLEDVVMSRNVDESVPMDCTSDSKESKELKESSDWKILEFTQEDCLAKIFEVIKKDDIELCTKLLLNRRELLHDCTSKRSLLLFALKYNSWQVTKFLLDSDPLQVLQVDRIFNYLPQNIPPKEVANFEIAKIIFETLKKLLSELNAKSARELSEVVSAFYKKCEMQQGLNKVLQKKTKLYHAMKETEAILKLKNETIKFSIQKFKIHFKNDDIKSKFEIVTAKMKPQKMEDHEEFCCLEFVKPILPFSKDNIPPIWGPLKLDNPKMSGKLPRKKDAGFKIYTDNDRGKEGGQKRKDPPKTDHASTAGLTDAQIAETTGIAKEQPSKKQKTF